MKENFRGDTFFRSYSIELENENYVFQSGDKIKVGFCRFNDKKELLKEIDLPIGKTEIDITWSADEMATLEIGDYILEAEVTTNDFVKTHQEKIKIDYDFIYGEE